MTVKSLCEKYGLKFQTVYKKITHHNGKIILYDTENIYRFNQLIRSIGTNINQIAMVVNSEKKVFKGDIDSLRKEVEKISNEFHSYIVSPQ